MGHISVFVLICVICTLAYGIGLLRFIADFEDKCEMTYTFEYPQFVRISLNLDVKYPKYGLYAYSEGRFTAKTRNKYFDGIPVLFIPGNGGSHKQVRSLSSVALRKMLDSGIPYHFDYFTVNLNEELSGLYGPLLFDQLEYINSSLYKILELYKGRSNRPKSVVIIGHSMGGVIGMKLLSQISDPEVIPILIALASPLRRPPFMLDYHMKKFYDEGFKNVPESTTLISLSGGYSDFLIPAFLSNVERNATLYAVTTNVPRAWIGTNHVQILWCKQIVLALNRALFDSVDTKTMHISSNTTYRSLVFHHHLVRHSGTYIRQYDKYSRVIDIDYKGQWIESVLKQYSIKLLQGVKEPHWYMVKLTSLPGYEVLSILTINLKTVDWIFVCNANALKGPTKVCTEGSHLTHLSKIAPSVMYKRRYFQINLHELRRSISDATHVAFRVLPTRDPVMFHVDVHGAVERRLTVDLPKWWSLNKKVILERTFEKALHYELLLPDLQHIIQYYQLFVDPINCGKGYHHASASLMVPWAHESYHSFVTSTESKPVNIRLYSSRPKNLNNQYASVRLSLEPSCNYRISIKSSMAGSLGQITRTYSSLLITNVAVIILMSLRHQLKCLEENNRCSIFFVALREGAKPYYILTITKILCHVSGSVMSYLPRPDIFYSINEGTEFFIMPLFMYICGVGIVCIVAVLFGISVVTLESSVHKLTLKLLAKTVSFNMVWSDYLMSALHKIPFVVAITLIALSLSTCGGLALCLGSIFYFLRLSQMSKDVVEDFVWFFVKRIANKLKHVFKRQSRGAVFTPKEFNPNRSTNNVKFDYHISGNSNGKMEGSSSVITQNNPIYENELNKIHSDDQEERGTTVEDDDVALANQALSGDTHVKNGSIVEQSGMIPEMEHNETSNQNDLNESESITEHLNRWSIAYNAIFFHTSLFFLWVTITVINIPAVLTWAHNFRFSKTLSPDDSFLPGITLSVCALPLWQSDLPKIGRKWLDKVRAFIMTIAISSLLFATVSIYRLNYLLSSIIVVITLHQLLAPNLTNLDDSNVDKNNKLDDIKDKYEKIKTKLD